jgi:hypothetical protein
MFLAALVKHEELAILSGMLTKLGLNLCHA